MNDDEELFPSTPIAERRKKRAAYHKEYMQRQKVKERVKQSNKKYREK